MLEEGPQADAEEENEEDKDDAENLSEHGDSEGSHYSYHLPCHSQIAPQLLKTSIFI
jgi:hypothetical protein